MNVVKTCANLGYLSAVCDKDLRPLEEIRSRYDDVRLFCDFDTMLQLGKITAVAIAAPAQYHSELAIRALQAGLDVFVEKPLALSVEDAQRVVETAAQLRRKLFVGHVLLYHPAVQAMLSMISSGSIGEVRHVRSRRSSWGRLREHEDVWWSFSPHDVALVLAIFGEEPESASGGAGAFVRPHIADIAYADFRFSMGRTAHVEANWIDPQKNSQTDVFGSTGVLSFRDGADGGTLRYTPVRRSAQYRRNRRARSRGDGRRPSRRGRASGDRNRSVCAVRARRPGSADRWSRRVGGRSSAFHGAGRVGSARAGAVAE